MNGANLSVGENSFLEENIIIYPRRQRTSIDGIPKTQILIFEPVKNQ